MTKPTDHEAVALALDRIDQHSRRIRLLAPLHLAQLERELAIADSLPATASGGTPDGSTGRTVLIDGERIAVTSVESAVLARERYTHRLDDTLDRLNTCGSVLRALANELAGEFVALPPPPRCSATGRDGAVEWGRPDCWNVPTRGPLCESCSKREYRWRKTHGLPPRSDGVFSQPGTREAS